MVGDRDFLARLKLPHDLRVAIGKDGQVDVKLPKTNGSITPSPATASIVVADPSLAPVAVLDATTFGGNSQLCDTKVDIRVFGDGFVPVDPVQTYQRSGWARSGDGRGGLYDPTNRQWFGFASFDIDKYAINPHHVLKVDGATDTRLARPLRKDDTTIPPATRIPTTRIHGL